MSGARSPLQDIRLPLSIKGHGFFTGVNKTPELSIPANKTDYRGVVVVVVVVSFCTWGVGVVVVVVVSVFLI